MHTCKHHPGRRKRHDTTNAGLVSFEPVAPATVSYVRVRRACACNQDGQRMQIETFVINFASADDAELGGAPRRTQADRRRRAWCVRHLGNSLWPYVGLTADAPLRQSNVSTSHEFPADFVDTSEELNTTVNDNVSATLRVTSLIAPAMACHGL